MFGKLKELFQFRKPESLRDTIEELIEEDKASEETTLEEEERKLISNVMRMHDLTADDVRIPRAEVMAVSTKAPYKEVAKLFLETGFARLPVYEESLDKVVGFIHSRDLLNVKKPESLNLAKLCHDVLFIAPSMRLLDLLLQMRSTRIPIAVVVDEYGDVDGVVTVWDVLREVIGDMSVVDKPEEKSPITRLSDSSIIVNARMDLDDFEQEIGKVLTKQEREEEDLDTVGGLVTFLAGHVPARKEVIAHSSGIEFEVLEADPRRVSRLRVYRRKKK